MKIRWLLAMLGSFAMPAFACDELVIADAWARQAPPGAPVMAGYLTLSNPGEEAVTVRAGNSADFKGVELHNMTHENGVMQMRKLESLDLAPGGEVALAPGGMHLMLIGPKRAFAAGDSIEIALDVCNGKVQSVRLPVLEAAPAVDGEHGQHSR